MRPEILKTTSKTNEKRPRDSLKSLQKQDTGGTETLSNYFTHKTHCFPEIIKTTSERKYKESPRLFQTTSKTNGKRPPRFLKPLQKQTTRDRRDS